MGERRFTIKQVADGTGLAYKTVHELYHDKTTRVDLATIDKLCDFFDVTPADLFEWRRTVTAEAGD